MKICQNYRIGYMTAVCAIIDGLRIPLPFLPDTPQSGRLPSSMLVLGGSSVTGAAAIQLLRMAHPLVPIYATSSPRNFARLDDLGVTEAFDYHSPSTATIHLRSWQTSGLKPHTRGALI